MASIDNTDAASAAPAAPSPEQAAPNTESNTTNAPWTKHMENTQDEAPTNTSERAPAPPARTSLADAQLEAHHADLPPLSTLPSSSAAETASGESRPVTRRGLGRGGSSSTAAPAPQIGVVENPTEISESLSGKFANGYDGRSSSNKSGTSVAATGDNPGEFVPPVSQKTQQAELNPERERRVREEKRQSRQDRDRRDFQRNDRDFQRGDRERADRKPEFMGHRREDRASEWAPTGNQSKSGSTPRPGAPNKLHVEAPAIPVQEEDSLWTKIKEFFAGLFGTSKDKPATPAKDAGSQRRDDRDNRRGRDWNGPGGRSRGGRGGFRHGNRNYGGNTQNYNRDGRHRPHAHGSGNSHRSPGES